MPIITVQMFEGRSLEQKRELVSSLTREMARICKLGESTIHVVIQETTKENWGMGGQLFSDRTPGKS
jgi:4-oxalocrotonate tautomerase